MSLIVDESFTSGIPAGFFSAIEGPGTNTASYTAGQGVTITTATGTHVLLPITAAGALGAFGVEIDCEFTASPGTTPAYQWGLGVKRDTATGNYAAALFHDNATPSLVNDLTTQQWVASMNSSNAQIATRTVKNEANTAGAIAPWPVALNERRRLRLDWDGAKGVTQFTVDDQPIYQFPKENFSFTSPTGYPAIYLYYGTLVVHRVRVWDTPTLQTLSGRTAGSQMGFAAPATPSPGPLNSIYRPMSARNLPAISAGTIQGTITHANPPGADVPQLAPVLLIDCATQQLVASTYADASGAYAFYGLDTTREYAVLTRDPTRTYNAVVQDRVLPV